ncbi:cytochrome-c oxidase, cbb3-type subunit III [Ferrovibrio sp.]|uniref:cytochrome-c oxidase, cbb3-type subunit III n=1 Tax=Ferrovibrio sp. TaxID=1917215 RepID=UPI003D0E0D32
MTEPKQANAGKADPGTTGHEWDGIQELNNPLPKWWLYTFYVTVVISVIWAVLYPSVPGFRSHFQGVLGYTQRNEVAENLRQAAAGQAVYRDRIRDLDVAAVKADPELYRFSIAGGRVLFAENCAGCHQSGGVGTKGYPSLADDEWLWGGSLADIERTIRFGIRSGHDDARQSQMPRFLADGLLPMKDVEAVADHVLSLGGQHAANANNASNDRGKSLFADNCAACHGDTARGNREVGAPNLVDRVWLYGGDRNTVVQSIAQSRNGVMPAWTGRLDEATIKMLAVYVHSLGGGE